jgi:hypothetical protein
MGLGGGGLMGGAANAAIDADDNPMLVIAVVEVDNLSPGDYLKSFEKYKQPIRVKHRWGGQVKLHPETGVSRVIILHQTSNDKPLPSVHRLYDARFKETFATQPADKRAVLDLAEWALEHGLNDKVVEVMKRYLEMDKTSPEAVAFLAIQKELAKPAEQEDPAEWRGKLFAGYKPTSKKDGHYVVIHDGPPEAIEVKTTLDLLEDNFHGFYYWWALRGKVLPVPRQKQVVVLTDKPDAFKRYQTILTAGGVVSDGFFARRENVTVVSRNRLDDTFDALEKFGASWWRVGYDRDLLLTGQTRGAVPNKGVTQEDTDDARMVALVRKALKTEQELGAVSHDASRQLVFASGLLPQNVAAPEWVQFGLGSLFETPAESPWSGVGAPSFYWLPRFKEMQGTRFERTAFETLRHVVTDAYFRAIPPRGTTEATHKAHDASERRARASAWSLTYFLAKENLDGLESYLKELSKMPRDMDLDEAALLGCFARAFKAVDASGKPDDKALADLANRWYSFIGNVTLESEEMRTQIRRFHLELMQQEIERAKQQKGPGGRPGDQGGKGPGA